MGIFDFFIKKPVTVYDAEVVEKQQPLKFDNDELSEVMEINPNKQLSEYKDLPQVIFGNG